MAVKDGLETKVAVIMEKVINIEGKVGKIEARLDSEYVTRGELNARVQLIEANNVALKESVELLKKIVYGVISLIITAVVGGGLAFLINKP